MILIVGASGRLGSVVMEKLLKQGKPVRAMTHTPSKVEELKKTGVEVVVGDLIDPASLAKACEGVEKVVASAQGLLGKGKYSPKTVDDLGNKHLIDAAKTAGVKHFVLITNILSAPDSPVEMGRCKFAAEQYLRSSGQSYTIIRPTAFMEFWGTFLGDSIVNGGKTLIFGRGESPVNFVCVEDVANLVLMALKDPKAKNRIIEIGGPEVLSMKQVVGIIERATGKSAKLSHIPVPMMRLMAVLMRLVNPVMSRLLKVSIYTDTNDDQLLDMSETLERFPISLTKFEDVLERYYAS